MKTISIGIVGDFNPKFDHHLATDESLKHSAARLGVEVKPEWIPTLSLEENPKNRLAALDGIWISSGSPYKSMEGALRSIQFARENDFPFFAT
jgi:CTP synthase (UTP-ammonia lyase)